MAQFATSAGITSRGSVQLTLGRLATRLGRVDAPGEHLAIAEDADDRLQAPLFKPAVRWRG